MQGFQSCVMEVVDVYPYRDSVYKEILISIMLQNISIVSCEFLEQLLMVYSVVSLS